MGSNAAAGDPRPLAGDTFRLAVLLPRPLPGIGAMRLLNEGGSPLPSLRIAFAWTKEVIRICLTFTPGTMNGSDIIVAATMSISTSISRGNTDASPVALDRNMYS